MQSDLGFDPADPSCLRWAWCRSGSLRRDTSRRHWKIGGNLNPTGIQPSRLYERGRRGTLGGWMVKKLCNSGIQRWQVVWNLNISTLLWVYIYIYIYNSLSLSLYIYIYTHTQIHTNCMHGRKNRNFMVVVSNHSDSSRFWIPGCQVHLWGWMETFPLHWCCAGLPWLPGGTIPPDFPSRKGL